MNRDVLALSLNAVGAYAIGSAVLEAVAQMLGVVIFFVGVLSSVGALAMWK